MSLLTAPHVTVGSREAHCALHIAVVFKPGAGTRDILLDKGRPEGTHLHARQVVSGRLFSEGLHVLGSAPGEPQMVQYLSAFFGDDLPEQVGVGHALPWPTLPLCPVLLLAPFDEVSTAKGACATSVHLHSECECGIKDWLIHARSIDVRVDGVQAISAVASGDDLDVVRCAACQ